MHSNAAELMHTRKRADRRMIFDQDMAGERSCVGHDDMVAQNTVVADVRIRHQEIVIPDPGVTAAAARSTMDIHVFTKNIVIADRQECFFAFEFQILGIQTDCRKRIEAIAFTNLRRPLDHDMRFETARFSYLNARANPAVRSDPHIITNLGFRADDGGGMDHGCCPMEESRIASAANSAPT